MTQKLSTFELLSLLEKELEFYRKGMLNIYATAIVAQVLVLTGQKVIKVEPAIVGQIVTAFFFLTIPVIVFVFYQRYGARIKFLRQKRTSLVEESGEKDPTNDPSVYVKSIYHIYIFFIAALSFVGVVMVAFGV